MVKCSLPSYEGLQGSTAESHVRHKFSVHMLLEGFLRNRLSLLEHQSQSRGMASNLDWKHHSWSGKVCTSAGASATWLLSSSAQGKTCCFKRLKLSDK